MDSYDIFKKQEVLILKEIKQLCIDSLMIQKDGIVFLHMKI